jgi:hypothetical protein
MPRSIGIDEMQRPKNSQNRLYPSQAESSVRASVQWATRQPCLGGLQSSGRAGASGRKMIGGQGSDSLA